jgi:hypothetical protein
MKSETLAVLLLLLELHPLYPRKLGRATNSINKKQGKGEKQILTGARLGEMA